MKQVVDALLPELLGELRELVAIPSIAFPGYPSEPVMQCANAVVDLLQRSGAPNARLVDVPGGYPAVYAEVPGPPGAPTVLLYAHYDVQPAPREQGWNTDPWTVTSGDDGRLYGRGVSDDKAGVVINAGILKAFDGKPPVTLRFIVEGEEETDSHLDAFIEANPEMVRCDAAIISDMGNPRSGSPALTTALRGVQNMVVKVRTLKDPVHSGLFGGAAPDAYIALTRMIASLHNDDGSVAVKGLHEYEWNEGSVDETEFRNNAGMLDGVELIGTGALASRLWSKPAISVIGVGAPPIDQPTAVVLPEASAFVSLRVAPGAEPAEQGKILEQHLRDVAPWGVQVEIEFGRSGPAFATTPSAAAREALREAYGTEVEAIGSGGSVPLVNTLQAISPDAPMILWGTHDTAKSRIHGSNESVDPDELKKILHASVLFLQKL